jgi:RsiW-degrading membrane proteinase PrsW (M82 family)
MASRTRSSNHRASVALLFGAVAVAAVPVAIYLTRRLPNTGLFDAVWSIPIGFGAGVVALLFARGARGTIARTLERSGGSARIRLGRLLAVAGICIALSASISVGVYEVLLRLEG